MIELSSIPGLLYCQGMMQTGGIVLCGGHSRRMGRSKAWLPFAGEFLLPRIVRLMSEAVAPVLVVAASGQELPPLPDTVEILRDAEPDRGPLQGLFTGLQALQGRVDAAYVTGCDVPLLRPVFILRMIELLGDQDICVPSIGAFLHPLAAVYRATVLPAAQDLLAQNRLRTAQLFENVPTRVVSEQELIDTDPTFASVRNVNTPEEYEQVLQELRSS